jgi:alkylhydroperoxidase/carboxymuconolactone decarboxylase family protein YurZ
MNAQDKTVTTQPLNAQQQSIVSISALTAVGDLEHLKTELNTRLNAGLTVNEIKEVLAQLYAYCGFPRSLNAITLLWQYRRKKIQRHYDEREKSNRYYRPTINTSKAESIGNID